MLVNCEYYKQLRFQIQMIDFKHATHYLQTRAQPFDKDRGFTKDDLYNLAVTTALTPKLLQSMFNSISEVTFHQRASAFFKANATVLPATIQHGSLTRKALLVTEKENDYVVSHVVNILLRQRRYKALMKACTKELADEVHSQLYEYMASRIQFSKHYREGLLAKANNW